MYGQNVNIRFGGPLTPIVKKLMIINGIIFLLQNIIDLIVSTPPGYPGPMEKIFGLSHVGLIYEFKLWQLFTYMFLHNDLMHIFFNLFSLWMFAGELEQLWGSKLFLKYYLYSGTGAGICIALLNYFNTTAITIGASGAIYAILLAYALTWPNREILLFFIMPIKIKYFIIGIGLFEFFGTLFSTGNISHIAHLGGLISGFIFIYFKSNLAKKHNASKSLKSDSNIFTSVIKKFKLKKKQREIETRIKAKKIIDQLLEKIAREGMSSLSSQEKRDLEWARRHYYPEGKDVLH